MIRALGTILTRPYLLRHPVQSAVIVAGVTLAVAGYASMNLANQAIRESFWAATDLIAGSAHLQISGADAGVPEEILERTNRVGCVDASTATIMRLVSTGLHPDTSLAVLGVDLLEEPHFREYRSGNRPAMDDALVFLAQPDSVMVTRDFAARNGLATGSPLAVWTGTERRQLRIRGLFDSEGIARAYGGNAALMDVYAAQHIFGTRGFFDRIDVRVRDGEDIDRCRVALAGALDAGLRIEPPPSRGKTVELFTNTYLLLVESTGLAGALIAIFLVTQAGAIAVAQREREIGVVIGLGADSSAIGRLVMVECAAAGLAGATGGIALGVTAAHRLGPLVMQLLAGESPVSVTLVYAMPDWKWCAATVLATSILCAIAARAPAARAARVAPIQLAEASRYSSLPEGDRSWPNFVALALLPGAAAWQFYDRRPEALYVTLPAAAAGISVVGGTLVRSAILAVRPLVTRIWKLEGRMAVDGLQHSIRRVRGTLIAMSLTAATVLAISNLAAGYEASFRRWTREVIGGDFLIHSGAKIAERGQLLPISLRARFESVPEIAAVIPVRRFTGRAAGGPAKLVATDLRAWASHGGPDAGGEDGALISQNLANKRGLRAGGRIRIESPAGPFELPVRRVISDHTSELGAVYFDWTVYRERFRTEAVELFSLYRRPGTTALEARRAVSARIGGETPVMILDGEEFRRQLDDLVRGWRRAGAVQAGIAGALSLIAVTGFLAVSVNARRRELGLLSVLGCSPYQIARCVFSEATAIAAAALLLGGMMAILLHSYLIFTLRYSVNGFQIPWVLDLPTAGMLLAALPAGAMLAALPTAIRLSRANLAAELEADV